MVESYYKASGKVLVNKSKDCVSVVNVNVNPAYVKKANDVVRVMTKNYEDELIYYFSLKPKFRATIGEELQRSFYIMKSLGDIANQYGEKELANDVSKRLNDLLTVYQPEFAEPALKQ